MITGAPAEKQREFLTKQLESDIVIVGGGLSGTCAALTAARAGATITLIQDRPVLGGNASSEVRMWMVGATAHLANNNRWAREGGVIDEIALDNIHLNPEGNPVIFDTILLDKVTQEPNITLLLNTVAFDVTKSDADTIKSVRAFNSQNQTMYEVTAPIFCDASGDGVVGFLAGAAFRMGAEDMEEFGEKFAPDKQIYGELLGQTIFFYTKDAGVPVKFTAPSFAHKDIPQRIPRHYLLNTKELGTRLWWIEYGGRLNTIHDTEEIKWELWRIIYGMWDYIKNSGKFPEAETMTLEWVGTVPGKRESRRFEGPYMLKQQDIVEQRRHNDAISYGGWSIDLHPADGIYSERPGCDQWHARGVYQIPYRCMYSRNITNLIITGRILSATHVAFGSPRVMMTLAHNGQAAGMAAALCVREKLSPDALSKPGKIEVLQRELMRTGHNIPGLKLEDPDDLAQTATVEATSTLQLSTLPPSGGWCKLERAVAQMLPVGAGPMPAVSFTAKAAAPTTLHLELRTNERPGNFTPYVMLATQKVELAAGEQTVNVDFDTTIDAPRYVFVCLMKNDQVEVRTSAQIITGLTTVRRTRTQQPDHDIGMEEFELWPPVRHPAGLNLAFSAEPAINAFSPANATNGLERPTNQPNAWVAALDDQAPALTLTWESPQTIARVELAFDTDFNNPAEHIWMGHPQRAIPFCIKHYRIKDNSGAVLAERDDNHRTRNTVVLNTPVTTDQLTFEVLEVNGNAPAAIFGVRCYK